MSLFFSTILTCSSDVDVPIRHSSQIRDVKDLLTRDGKCLSSGKRIVVVGGQMSGVEIAGTIAFQISSLVNSPGERAISDASKYVVTHVFEKPSWIMPLFFPNNPEIELNDKKVEVCYGCQIGQ